MTAATPEGLRYLTDCIAALRGKHMAFLHGAAVDLQSRADALRTEAGKHAAAVADLADLAAGLEARQELLEARLSRVQLLHDNLVERAGTVHRPAQLGEPVVQYTVLPPGSLRTGDRASRQAVASD